MFAGLISVFGFVLLFDLGDFWGWFSLIGVWLVIVGFCFLIFRLVF